VLEGRSLPSTLTVMTTADSGPGSLRADIAAAQSGDTINFDPGLNGQTITLTSGELAISKSLTIEGPGVSQLAVSGNGASRIFDVTSQNATVTITGLTMENGNTTGDGGGIENRGTLTVTNSTLQLNNALGNGGGVDNRGNLTVNGVTFSGNNAGNDGGAVENRASLTMTGCTVGGTGPFGVFPLPNSANNEGGAVENRGTATITASVFSYNLGNTGGAIYNLGSLAVQGSEFDNNDLFAIGNFGNLTLSASTFLANSSGDLFNSGTATLSNCNLGNVWNFGALSVVDQSLVALLYNAGSLTVSSDSTITIVVPIS
jgi:hypothetical protein